MSRGSKARARRTTATKGSVSLRQTHQALELVGAALDQAFRLMNLYAKDPYDMGQKNRWSRTDPQAVLAEVYFILAPAQEALIQLRTDCNFQAVRERVMAKIDDEAALEIAKWVTEVDRRIKEEEQRLNKRLAEYASREAAADRAHAQFMKRHENVREQVEAQLRLLDTKVRLRSRVVANFLRRTERFVPQRLETKRDIAL